ncbi:MAG: glycine cleavage system aminomethyltransferase GcvT [Tannerella sp.]|jgi:aminomethyltransferase|nr:glycine cleavage system aminomethyltransferase GcvT [Tannerella sp.]
MKPKTPLYDSHLKCGGAMVSFAGYLLPVQYPTGIIAEHLAVRNAAGLFDVSHMGEIILGGQDALNNLNYLMTNDFTSMKDGQVRYSLMCCDNGGCIDDVLVYRFHQNRYMIVVNASNRTKDLEWITKYRSGDVRILDISDSTAQIALQGPRSKDIMLRLVPENLLPHKYYHFLYDIDLKGINALISQTGYTGEFGYEIYTSNADAPKLWDMLLQTGKDEGLIPCGLGARDTLRLEAAMPLYGHEMDENITPLETGLNFGVKMNKDDFIGKKAMQEKGEPNIERVGLKITGRGIARERQDVYSNNRKTGYTTSGTHSPFLKYPIAMALLEKGSAPIGSKVEIDVRGKRIEAEVIQMPFYKPEIHNQKK